MTDPTSHALRGRPRLLPLLTALLGLTGCDLAALEENVCGNHVIELNEDCDGLGVGSNACNDACRVVCSDAGACPVGWGCGTDGICRQPSGLLEARGGAVALPADTITLADIDGDGRQDVVASQDSTLSIAFVDDSGFLPEVLRSSFEPIDEFADRPGVGDLNEDGLADLVVRVGEGLGVLMGTGDRTLLPFPFRRTPPEGFLPGDVLLPLDFDPRPQAPGDELFAVADDGLYLLETYDEEAVLPQKVFGWPAAQGAVPFVTPLTAVVSTFDAMTGMQTQSGPGTDIAVAFDGDDVVRVFDGFLYVQEGTGYVVKPNAAPGGALLRPPAVITLPPGGVVRGPPQVASVSLQTDLDEEGIDLLIPGELDGVPVIFVAFQSSLGWGSDPVTNTADGVAGRLHRTLQGVPIDGVPFATGRFNLDGFMDFVDADGVYVSACSPDLSNCPYTTNSLTIDYAELAIPDGTEGWTNAFVLAGGLTDYYQGDVLTTSPKPGFTFFKRGDGGFAKFQIPTAAPVEQIDFGDFNGDGARDLVFTHLSTRRTPERPDLRAIFVSFGDALGLPTEPVDLGDVGEVARVFRARVPDVTAFPDTVDDIYALTSMQDEFFLFRGSTDRSILSPLDLELVCPEPPYGAARVFAMGEFDPAPGAEVAVLHQDIDDDGETFLWELWSVAPRSPKTLEVCDGAVGPAVLEEPGADELVMVALDLEDDEGGVDEVVVLPVGTSTLFVGRLGGAGWEFDPALELPGPATSLRTTTIAGAPGLLLWSAGEVMALGAVGGELVLTSTLALDGATCPAPLDDRPLGPVRDVTAIQLDPGRARDLLVLTPGNVLQVDVGAAGDLTPVACLADTFQGGGGAIAADDLDGDGVEDVVIARAGGTRLFAGIPVVR